MIASRAMTARQSVLVSTAAMVCAALALWVSGGMTAFITADSRGVRVALLPPPLWLVAWIVGAVVVSAVFKPGPTRVRPLWLSAILLLQWLPFRLPPAVFLWTGALRWWVWAAIVAALIAPPIGRWVWRAHREFIIVPHRA